jgi:hypothetical protein
MLRVCIDLCLCVCEHSGAHRRTHTHTHTRGCTSPFVQTHQNMSVHHGTKDSIIIHQYLERVLVLLLSAIGPSTRLQRILNMSFGYLLFYDGNSGIAITHIVQHQHFTFEPELVFGTHACSTRVSRMPASHARLESPRTQTMPGAFSTTSASGGVAGRPCQQRWPVTQAEAWAGCSALLSILPYGLTCVLFSLHCVRCCMAPRAHASLGEWIRMGVGSMLTRTS